MMEEPRYTASTITDDALDALYSELEDLRKIKGQLDDYDYYDYD